MSNIDINFIYRMALGMFEMFCKTAPLILWSSSM